MKRCIAGRSILRFGCWRAHWIHDQYSENEGATSATAAAGVPNCQFSAWNEKPQSLWRELRHLEKLCAVTTCDRATTLWVSISMLSHVVGDCADCAPSCRFLLVYFGGASALWTCPASRKLRRGHFVSTRGIGVVLMVLPLCDVGVTWCHLYFSHSLSFLPVSVSSLLYLPVLHFSLLILRN